MAEQKTLKLSVDTGSVLVDIEDRGEKIGEFRFNPADIDIVRRYEKMAEYLDNAEIGENVGAEEILAFTDKIREQFDYLLNYKVSDTLFAKCNPLTPLANGDFYCEHILEGIEGLIEKEMGQRIAKKKAKIQKATAKYHK
ncbi:MAG: hypothetical protein Q4D16_03495 [Eubacteriales bacterium]|nr:hypothetical protein [Eubacteriales bacterium]